MTRKLRVCHDPVETNGRLEDMGSQCIADLPAEELT